MQLSAGAASATLTCLRHASGTGSFMQAGCGSFTKVVGAPVVGHRYEPKLKIEMSFEEAAERFADVRRPEMEVLEANSPRLRRVQRRGWRGSVALVDLEAIEEIDVHEIEIDPSRRGPAS